jgi:hypothetical protein
VNQRVDNSVYVIEGDQLSVPEEHRVDGGRTEQKVDAANQRHLYKYRKNKFKLFSSF